MKKKSSKKSRASPSKKTLLTGKQVDAIDQLTSIAQSLDDAATNGPSPPEVPPEDIQEYTQHLTAALEVLDWCVFFTLVSLAFHYLVTGDVVKAVSTFASALSTAIKVLQKHLKRNRPK